MLKPLLLPDGTRVMPDYVVAVSVHEGFTFEAFPSEGRDDIPVQARVRVGFRDGTGVFLTCESDDAARAMCESIGSAWDAALADPRPDPPDVLPTLRAASFTLDLAADGERDPMTAIDMVRGELAAVVREMAGGRAGS